MHMYVTHIVLITDSLDCRLDSSLRPRHLSGWEMIVPIQMLPC